MSKKTSHNQKIVIDVTNSNATNIEMTLTIIPDLYSWSKTQCLPEAQLMWWIPS
jgi:hypothetical protein